MIRGETSEPGPFDSLIYENVMRHLTIGDTRLSMAAIGRKPLSAIARSGQKVGRRRGNE